jgi:hypothetical protein
MQDRKDERQELGEQETARRDLLSRLGRASLGIPAMVMLMSVTEKKASATGNSASGGPSRSGLFDGTNPGRGGGRGTGRGSGNGHRGTNNPGG